MMRRVVYSLVAAVLVLVGLAGCGEPPVADLCKSRQAGDLVITEVLNDPDGQDTGYEFIEVYNPKSTPVELRGVSVYVSNLDGSGLKSHIILTGTAEPKSYFTLGDIRGGQLPEYINYSYGASLGSLPNSNLVVGFKCQTTLIDEVRLVKDATPGRSRQLKPDAPLDAVANDDETNFCSAEEQGPTASFASPQQPNGPCLLEIPKGSCLDGNTVRAIVPPTAGQLFISELMADSKAVADDKGEWIELHATGPCDLNGLTLAASSGKRTISNPECLHVIAGSDVLLAHDTDPLKNGGLPPVTTTFNFSLPQAGGALSLSYGDAGIDEAVYSKAVAGVAWQLDPTRFTPLDNDDPAAFCPATAWISGTPDAGDRGTPGLPNTTCPPQVLAGQCLDPQTAQVRAIVKPQAAELVVSEIMFDPSITEPAGEWLELYSTAEVDLNDLVVRAGSTSRALKSQTCVRPGAGQYALLVNNPDPDRNGSLPDFAFSYGSLSLSNSGGLVSLELPDDAGVVDSAPYLAATAAGAGVSRQLPPERLDAVSNDDAGSFCFTPPEFRYGDSPDGGADGGLLLGQRGTPGQPNVPCP